MVGVEDVLQGLHVGGGRGVPIAEDILVGVADGIVAVGIDEQHGTASPGPGGAVIVGIFAHHELARRRQLRDADALAGEVEDDGERGVAIVRAALVRSGIIRVREVPHGIVEPTSRGAAAKAEPADADRRLIWIRSTNRRLAYGLWCSWIVGRRSNTWRVASRNTVRVRRNGSWGWSRCCSRLTWDCRGIGSRVRGIEGSGNASFVEGVVRVVVLRIWCRGHLRRDRGSRVRGIKGSRHTDCVERIKWIVARRSSH